GDNYFNFFHYSFSPSSIRVQRSLSRVLNLFITILFVMICMANSLNIDLETAHNIVMNKFNTRDKDRWTRIDEGEKE
ncbi:hypothetical protein ACT453_52650, partial [Bacillus sp. D-CC]